MKFNALDLIMGGPIPEGYAAVYGARLSLDEPQLIFQQTLETDYYFRLDTLRCKFPFVAGSAPAVEFFRDQGQRAYQQGNLGVNAVDLRTLAGPGEQDTATSPLTMRPVVPMEMWFTPGCVLVAKISGYLPGAGGLFMDIHFHGRYYLDPEAA